MEKKTYYVTMAVGSYTGQIRNEIDPNDPYYDFEIRAASKEIVDLAELFEKTYEVDFLNFAKAHIPFKTKELMQENKKEDALISDIYQMIYKLGTAETKKKMKEANLIS